LRHGIWGREEDGSPPTLLMRNVITRAIGTQPTVHPDIGVIRLRSKDIYMICSDGLSDYVEENKVAHLLSSPYSLEEIGKNLIKSALEKGGNDNITLLLVKIL
jgi:PPM family protein phosphatase